MKKTALPSLKNLKRAAIITLGLSAITPFITNPAYACSRVLWNTVGQPIISARSMDWGHSFDDWMFVNPRGQKMTGGNIKNAHEWTSKYGSVVTSVSGYAKQYGFDWSKDGASDGINEKGFAAHLLFLDETTYPDPATDQRPGISYMRWVRYLLDNFANVKEAVAGMDNIRIEGVPLGDHVLGLHIAIEDPSGNSAIFEFIDGKLQIDTGKEYTVMTNDPVYSKHIENRKTYKGFGGEKPLPGDTSSEDRFVRASYYLHYLPKPKDAIEAAASIQSVILNTAVPFGAPYGDGVYPTWWVTVTDLTNKVYYFNWTKTPNTIWVELENFDFSEGNPTLQLNPRESKLAGEVSKLFMPIEK